MSGRLRSRVPTGISLGPVELMELLGNQAGVRANMVASVDGRATVAGRVGRLTGPADQALLLALRGWCDVLLVGPGTVSAEGYGVIELPPEIAAVRAGRGQPLHPVVAVLAGSRSLDPALPVFAAAGSGTAPWLITAAGAHRGGPPAGVRVLEVTPGPDGRPSLAAVLDRLRAAGLGRVLSEGGPTILGRLLGDGLVDELFLTVSPLVVGGAGIGIVHAPEFVQPLALQLLDVLGGEGEVFLRYAADVRP